MYEIDKLINLINMIFYNTKFKAGLSMQQIMSLEMKLGVLLVIRRLSMLSFYMLRALA